MQILNRLLREPLLHFIVIGGLVFAVYYLTRGYDKTPSDLILVTPEKFSQLGAQFSAVWRRNPTDKELNRLIEDYIREEVYYRDALTLGLDNNDAVVRRRLRQKMEFLANSAANILTPKPDELETYFKTHIKSYQREPRIAFEQIFLGPNPDSAEVQRWLSSLQAGQEPESDPIGQSTLLPAQLNLSPRVAVDGVFGSHFFDRLISLPVNSWSGPVKSSYGVHLVRIQKRTALETPSLDQVQSAVIRDWRNAKAKELREKDYLNRRAKYAIEIQRDESKNTDRK